MKSARIFVLVLVFGSLSVCLVSRHVCVSHAATRGHLGSNPCLASPPLARGRPLCSQRCARGRAPRLSPRPPPWPRGLVPAPPLRAPANWPATCWAHRAAASGGQRSWFRLRSPAARFPAPRAGAVASGSERSLWVSPFPHSVACTPLRQRGGTRGRTPPSFSAESPRRVFSFSSGIERGKVWVCSVLGDGSRVGEYASTRGFGKGPPSSRSIFCVPSWQSYPSPKINFTIYSLGHPLGGSRCNKSCCVIPLVAFFR